MAKSTAARAAARFRQLCCFGLDREAVIPELLKELHALVPSFSNTFHFADRKGALANIYFENTDLVRLWPLYQQEILERTERKIKGLAFSDASRTWVGVHEFREAVSDDKEIFRRSDHFNLVVRPVGYDSNFLRLYFRDQGRVLGGLTVWRDPSAAKWNPEEKRRLASLEAFFVHALTAPPVGGAPMVDDGASGLIIADTAGRPLHFSADGRRLLFLASNPRTTPGSTVGRSVALPAPVAQLCRRLSAIFSDDHDLSAFIPTYHHSNVWGGFTFRAQWLEQQESGSGLIGITVNHKVPLPIKLIRSVARFPLSRRQAEVCVLIATGASNDTVAERLGISRHTANEHLRWIYHKLDVHGRAELVSKMLSS